MIESTYDSESGLNNGAGGKTRRSQRTTGKGDQPELPSLGDMKVRKQVLRMNDKYQIPTLIADLKEDKQFLDSNTGYDEDKDNNLNKNEDYFTISSNFQQEFLRDFGQYLKGYYYLQTKSFEGVRPLDFTFYQNRENLEILMKVYHFADKNYYEINAIPLWSEIPKLFPQESEKKILGEVKEFYQNHLFYFERFSKLTEDARNLQNLLNILSMDVNRLHNPVVYDRIVRGFDPNAHICGLFTKFAENYINESMFCIENICKQHAMVPVDVVIQPFDIDTIRFSQSPRREYLERNMCLGDFYKYMRESARMEPKCAKSPDGLIKYAVVPEIFDWVQELYEIETKLPKEFQFNSDMDVFKVLKNKGRLVNSPSFVYMVEGSWIGGRERPLRLRGFNLNLGPDGCCWYVIPPDSAAAFRKAADEKLRAKIYEEENNWFSEIDFCLQNEIEIYYFMQHPGDLINLAPGCIYWCKSQGISESLEWNIFERNLAQFRKAFERMQVDKELKIRTNVPIRNIAVEFLFSEYPKLDHGLKEFLIKEISQIFKEEQKLFNEFRIRNPGNAVFTYEPDDQRMSYFCYKCKIEILNFYAICGSCSKSKKIGRKFSHLICLDCYQDHSMECKEGGLDLQLFQRFSYKLLGDLIQEMERIKNHDYKITFNFETFISNYKAQEPKKGQGRPEENFYKDLKKEDIDDKLLMADTLRQSDDMDYEEEKKGKKGKREPATRSRKAATKAKEAVENVITKTEWEAKQKDIPEVKTKATARGKKAMAEPLIMPDTNKFPTDMKKFPTDKSIGMDSGLEISRSQSLTDGHKMQTRKDISQQMKYEHNPGMKSEYPEINKPITRGNSVSNNNMQQFGPSPSMGSNPTTPYNPTGYVQNNYQVPNNFNVQNPYNTYEKQEEMKKDYPQDNKKKIHPPTNQNPNMGMQQNPQNMQMMNQNPQMQQQMQPQQMQPNDPKNNMNPPYDPKLTADFANFMKMINSNPYLMKNYPELASTMANFNMNHNMGGMNNMGMNNMNPNMGMNNMGMNPMGNMPMQNNMQQNMGQQMPNNMQGNMNPNMNMQMPQQNMSKQMPQQNVQQMNPMMNNIMQQPSPSMQQVPNQQPNYQPSGKGNKMMQNEFPTQTKKGESKQQVQPPNTMAEKTQTQNPNQMPMNQNQNQMTMNANPSQMNMNPNANQMTMNQNYQQMQPNNQYMNNQPNMNYNPNYNPNFNMYLQQLRKMDPKAISMPPEMRNKTSNPNQQMPPNMMPRNIPMNQMNQTPQQTNPNQQMPDMNKQYMQQMNPNYMPQQQVPTQQQQVPTQQQVPPQQQQRVKTQQIPPNANMMANPNYNMHPGVQQQQTANPLAKRKMDEMMPKQMMGGNYPNQYMRPDMMQYGMQNVNAYPQPMSPMNAMNQSLSPIHNPGVEPLFPGEELMEDVRKKRKPFDGTEMDYDNFRIGDKFDDPDNFFNSDEKNMDMLFEGYYGKKE